MNKKRVLSGTRATGKLHLGNYLGAVKGYIALSEDPEYETFYMVADLHSVNTPYYPKDFPKKVRSVVLDYLGAGLDPEKCTIFIQSHVPQHIQLFYLLSTQVSVARMQHLPTYKEKVKQYPKDVNMALLNYPVLMASDILIYKADAVPVGVDQLPHLEVAREVARKMNEKYGTDFPEPEQFKTDGEYVPSLTGEGKMSKSVEGSYITLVDSLETIKSRLASTPTDSGKGDIKEGLFFSQESMKEASVPEDLVPSNGVGSLMKFVELFQGKEKRKEYESQYEGEGVRYGDLKNELSEAIYKHLEPIQERRKKFEDDPKLVEEILQGGAQKARKVAEKTVTEVKAAMGLI
ncbi:tryptophan--tRNA ligase [Candidatus Woesebacteria bacterium]|nr:tryptophan--tRNA ligase [Candidatus Woesebacteria bacterium]